MELSSLSAISPLDGRYGSKLKELRNYFSEYALIKYRYMVEVEYFVALCEMPLPQLIRFPKKELKAVKELAKTFNEASAIRIKEIESEINHDVKAVEYYLKERLTEMGFAEYAEFVHFGLTSQDINNTAQPYILKNFVENMYSPFLEEELMKELNTMAAEWKNVPMLARTHGQSASPTTVGRELMVFVERMIHQLKLMKQVPHTCKFGGATGGLNAHYASYGAIDWHTFASEFTMNKLGLERQKITTQIDHYDYMAALFDSIRRINVILIDLCRDIWTYISLDYFGQRIKKSEVGSSAMPHKVNPIDFENAEGNLMLANALFDFLSNKLPVSRLQRDLTDSTVTRNIGVAFGHTMLAFKSLQKGLDKLTINKPKIQKDLLDNYVVVSEAIQSILRREGFPKPYEALKSLTRANKQVTKESLAKFIDELEISDDVKEELKELSPETYIGVTNAGTILKPG